ncbi:TetR family transcriptional regulator [Herbihabitans rhizosphaerae]|uniref:TetR family transcriptional regulator n=1 Tax=Herbihabitans rhizosphaerae TaxID=1872711 RepID=A0A4Q7L6W0_9PSEU|nr:TetR/AcrR family transcriptional regulator [Herbihabitans rhizosphaerae]RZS45064.1 TetR family transcriptional regulator [Herbihabitans rhizosphaerae]
MGNREDLLAGAKRCLLENGYARTTARDIATTSGVSLAAIGYHFGSKEALLHAALTEIVGAEIGEEITDAIKRTDRRDTAIQRFETMWRQLIESFPKHRPLLVASMERLAQLEHVPAVRESLADGQRRSIDTIAELFRDTHHLDDQDAHAVSALSYALLNGIMFMWLTDPETTPDAHTLRRALTALAETPSAIPTTEPPNGDVS